MNVESENESTNDARMGLEFAMLLHRWYFAAEAYWMNVGFTKRQKISEHYNYLGGYLQGAISSRHRCNSQHATIS